MSQLNFENFYNNIRTYIIIAEAVYRRRIAIVYFVIFYTSVCMYCMVTSYLRFLHISLHYIR